MYKEIQKIIGQYLETFPEEKERLTLVTERFPLNADITSRKNFAGHVTVSAIIFSPEKDRMLCIFHRQLQLLLQPGGHVESFDKNLLDACLREVLEETGLNDLELINLVGEQSPIDIDIHRVPTNESKDEVSHHHFDFRFVFVAKSSTVTIQEEEVEGYQWITLDEISQIKRFRSIIEKIDACLQNKKVLA